MLGGDEMWKRQIERGGVQRVEVKNVVGIDDVVRDIVADDRGQGIIRALCPVEHRVQIGSQCQ